MRGVTLASILALPLLLGACGAADEPPAADDAAADAAPAAPEATLAAAARPAAWPQCQSCHSVEAGRPNGVGPNLHGVVGRKAGSVAGFSYSPGMKDSGLTWDAATLDKYLENPRGMIPTTKMAFAGVKDAAARQALVAWLAEQK